MLRFLMLRRGILGYVAAWVVSPGLAVLAVLGAAPAVLADTPTPPPTAPQIVPCAWDQQVDLANNPMAQAIFHILQFVLPIVGGVLLVLAAYHMLSTIGHGITASKKLQSAGTMVPADIGGTPVASRLLEIILGILLIALPLSGQWVPLMNGILNLGLTVIHGVATALGAGC